MTSTEAPFSATFKVPPRDRDGDLWTARGNTIEEFKANVAALKEFLGGAITEQQAIQNLQDSGLVSGNAGMQTVAQPGFTKQQAAASDIPPGVDYPGDCAHGRMVYHAKTAKVGERFECSIPWSRDAKGRCTTKWVKR